MNLKMPRSPTDAARQQRLAQLFLDLEKEPFKQDFYQTLRLIEALQPKQKRLGESVRPQEDAIRLGQEPSMAFAPAAIMHFAPATDKSKPRLEVRFFGFLGPNGPLPLHLTEFALQRIRHHNDQTLCRFLDLFHHRLLSLFYRSWAQANPVVSLDRPAHDRFGTHVGALAGYGMPQLRSRDAIPNTARQYFAGLLSRNVRHSEGIAAIVSSFFKVPARIESFIGHWMPLQSCDRTKLGQRTISSRLGRGATLGAAVWDRQHKIRLVLGPMCLEKYEDLLPCGSAGKTLRTWLLSYFGYEMKCDVQLVLKREEVPSATLSQVGRLGWSSWCGSRNNPSDAQDLIMDSERFALIENNF